MIIALCYSGLCCLVKTFFMVLLNKIVKEICFKNYYSMAKFIFVKLSFDFNLQI